MIINAKNLASYCLGFNVITNLAPPYDMKNVYMQLVLEYLVSCASCVKLCVGNVPYCINKIIFNVFSIVDC